MSRMPNDDDIQSWIHISDAFASVLTKATAHFLEDHGPEPDPENENEEIEHGQDHGRG